jgi:hypothetical protein
MMLRPMMQMGQHDPGSVAGIPQIVAAPPQPTGVFSK